MFARPSSEMSEDLSLNTKSFLSWEVSPILPSVQGNYSVYPIKVRLDKL